MTNNLENIYNDIDVYLIDKYQDVIKYIKKNKSIISQIPKWYWLSNGKTGWSGEKSSSCEYGVIPICYGYCVESKSALLFERYFDGECEFKYIESEEDILRFMKKIVYNKVEMDFRHELNKYKRDAEKPYGSVPSLRSLHDFFYESIRYGYDISYKEFIVYYHGRPEKELKLSEKEYYNMLDETRVEVVKNILVK